MVLKKRVQLHNIFPFNAKSIRCVKLMKSSVQICEDMYEECSVSSVLEKIQPDCLWMYNVIFNNFLKESKKAVNWSMLPESDVLQLIPP